VEAKVLALSEAVGTSAEQLGYWPVDIAMRAIEQVHMVSGMPYWTSIVAVTVATRLTLAPLMVWQSRMVARLQAAKPEVEEVQARMKAIPKLSTEQLMGFRDEMNAIWAKHEVTPLAPFKVHIYHHNPPSAPPGLKTPICPGTTSDYDSRYQHVLGLRAHAHSLPRVDQWRRLMVCGSLRR
jgi:hypothetical protein